MLLRWLLAVGVNEGDKKETAKTGRDEIFFLFFFKSKN